MYVLTCQDKYVWSCVNEIAASVPEDHPEAAPYGSPIIIPLINPYVGCIRLMHIVKQGAKQERKKEVYRITLLHLVPLRLAIDRCTASAWVRVDAPRGRRRSVLDCRSSRSFQRVKGRGEGVTTARTRTRTRGREVTVTVNTTRTDRRDLPSEDPRPRPQRCARCRASLTPSRVCSPLRTERTKGHKTA